MNVYSVQTTVSGDQILPTSSDTCLERHNIEIFATNRLGSGVFIISGRTAAHRTDVLKNQEFMVKF